VHLVNFISRMYHDARSSERQIHIYIYSFIFVFQYQSSCAWTFTLLSYTVQNQGKRRLNWLTSPYLKYTLIMQRLYLSSVHLVTTLQHY